MLCDFIPHWITTWFQFSNTAQPQKCQDCGIWAPSKRSLTVHRMLFHKKASNSGSANKSPAASASGREQDRQGEQKRSSSSGQDHSPKRAWTAGYRCRICLGSFQSRTDLFRHKLRNHTDGKNHQDWPHPLPWESGDGTVNRNIQNVMNDNRGFILAPHDVNNLTSSYNISVSGNMSRVDFDVATSMRKALNYVLEMNQVQSFKINTALGFILINVRWAALFFSPSVQHHSGCTSQNRSP